MKKLLDMLARSALEDLESLGWHLVYKSKNSIRIFKQSEEADLIGVSKIEKCFSENPYEIFYIGQFMIRSLNGEYILKYRKKMKEKSEVLLWLTRRCFGTAEAYLSNQTNIKEIKEVFKKYGKPEIKKPDDEKPKFFTGMYLMKLH